MSEKNKDKLVPAERTGYCRSDLSRWKKLDFIRPAVVGGKQHYRASCFEEKDRLIEIGTALVLDKGGRRRGRIALVEIAAALRAAGHLPLPRRA